MIKYKFIKEDVLKLGESDYLLIAESPYELLSQMFEGNESVEEIDEIIENIEKVQSDQLEEYWFGNETGFLGIAIMDDNDDPQNWPKGAYIYDQYSEQPETHKFVLPIEDILQILKDYKKFIVDNKQ